MSALVITTVIGTATTSCAKEKKRKAPEKKKNPDDSSKVEESTESKKPHKTKTAFQTLDILPEGSILRRVRLPRYDKDFNPISLLTAEKLTVLDRDQIQAEGVSVELYGKDGSVQARTKMNRAIYNQKDSTLVAKQAVFIEGASYKASGTGLIYDWKTGQGFLQGPVSTLFQIKESDSSKKPAPSQK